MKRFLALLAVAALVQACGSSQPSATPSAPLPTTATTSGAPTPIPSPTPTVRATPPVGTVPPFWLGARPLRQTADGFGVQQPTPRELRIRRFTLPDSIPMLPGSGFASKVVDPAPASVIARSTWAPGCPVKATDLAWVRLTFRGFEGRRHTGELLVNRAVVADVVSVFRTLYAADFPIEQMRITSKSVQQAAPTGDGNDTESFNCRPAVGSQVFSQHAYGLAIDLNPFQNPYEKDGLVLPELAGAYTNRSWVRPGMILAGGPAVRAFTAIGWGWGGSWHSLKDLQHFSQNDR